MSGTCCVVLLQLGETIVATTHSAVQLRVLGGACRAKNSGLSPLRPDSDTVSIFEGCWGANHDLLSADEALGYFDTT